MKIYNVRFIIEDVYMYGYFGDIFFGLFLIFNYDFNLYIVYLFFRDLLIGEYFLFLFNEFSICICGCC